MSSRHLPHKNRFRAGYERLGLVAILLIVVAGVSLGRPVPGLASGNGLPAAQYSLVGDPNFNANNLPPEIRVWYDHMWAALTNGRTYPDPDAIASSGDLYQIGRTLNLHVTAMLTALRVTGDLRFLDEVDRVMELARRELKDYNNDGYLNWRWLYDPSSVLCGNDHHKMDEMLAHTTVAAAAYALQVNGQFNPVYAQHAAFWLDYLENHFFPKWAARGGIDKSLTHPFAHFMRMNYYMYRLTGGTAYLNEAERRAGVIDGMMAERNTAHGVAFTWDHRVPNMGKEPWGCQPTGYASFTVNALTDMALEGFSYYASDDYMRHYTITYRDLVLKYGTNQMAGNVCGSGTESFGKFLFSGMAAMAYWDDTGWFTSFNEQAYADNEIIDNPQRIFIPAYMMFTLSRGTSSDPRPTAPPPTSAPSATSPPATSTPLPVASPTPTVAPLPTSVPGSGRVSLNLQALYTFEEGAGTVVHDVSGVGAPLDLAISNTAGINWLASGLSVTAPTLIASPGAASKIINSAQGTNEITIEAWIKPVNTSQDGPARIVTLSQDAYNRHFTLGQGSWGVQPANFYDVRLRTTTRTSNGKPSLTAPSGCLTTTLSHVVYTRDAGGTARLYVDGVLWVVGTVDGSLANWDDSYRLALANELTGERPWLGDYHLVAIYNRALTDSEVAQNLGAGPDGGSTAPSPTATDEPTVPPTATETPLPTATLTATATPTATVTALPTETATATVPPTEEPTLSPTATDLPVEPPAPSGERITNGLQALYTFEEGAGTTVRDVSGVGTPLDLAIGDTANVSWVTGALAVTGETLIASSGPASKLIDSSRASNEITIEAWIKPANLSQDGPARIVTLSENPYRRNFTLGQGVYGVQPADFYDVRLRTTDRTVNGFPSLTGPRGSLDTTLTHVVYTRDATGTARIYVNGVEVATGNVAGDLSNWDNAYRLALANELTGGRPWLGEFHLVAVYSRALAGSEVGQNWQAGPGGTAAVPAPEPSPTPLPTSEPSPTPSPEPVEAGTGDERGLQGEYFNEADFTDLALTRTDPTIDFNWGYGAPNLAVEADLFSIRWTGYVMPLYTETYTFYTQSDDGVRLWVNGELLIDNWTTHATIEDSGSIDLVAGQPYAIRLEFYEGRAHAVIHLLWESSSQPKEVVPASQLAPVQPPEVMAPAGERDGITVEAQAVGLPVNDTFDSGLGWIPEGGLWQLDEATGRSGASWWADASQRGSSSTLTFVGQVHLDDATAPQLSFWELASLPDGDALVVDISLDDGVSWSTLDQYTGITGTWTQRVIDLTPYSGQTVRLRFRIETTGAALDTSSQVGAWIDDLSIEDTAATP